MRIDNYSVAMDSQFFNYKSALTEVSSTLTTAKDFQNNASAQTRQVAGAGNLQTQNDNLVIKDLSAAILKNIHSQTSQGVSIKFTYAEAQALNFQTTATVKTQDKEIQLNLQVSLSRSFVQQNSLSLEDVKAMQDPLVLNLNGTMPSLSTKTFSFDIDSDGKKDQISMLSGGNAFLALDKNANGKIDNGSELFGTKSGNGFSDLAQYDEDGNGWIDENDAIFDKLRIWKKSENGDDLVALGEAGIGAIFLGNIYTPYELKSASNEQLGQIKNSGFFLFESGKSGVISQLDLAVSQDSKEELQKFSLANTNLKKLQAAGTYQNESSENENTLEKQLEKLQRLLSSLENKLAQAQDDEKATLHAQIGTVLSQMLALISEQYKA